MKRTSESERQRHVGWTIREQNGEMFVEVPANEWFRMRALALIRDISPEVLLATAWRSYFSKEKKRFNGDSA